MANLPHQIKDHELQQIAGAFGECTRVDIIYDNYTGNPKGYAFVHFADEAGAALALKGMDGLEVMGRQLTARQRTGSRSVRRTGTGSGGDRSI